MGVFSDVLVPMEELIIATEGIGEDIMRQKLEEPLATVRIITNELLLRAVAKSIEQRR